MASMFESTDWEERVKAVELIDDVQVRSIRWRALAKEAYGDRECLVDLIRRSPCRASLIFARHQAMRSIREDDEVRDAFNARLAELGGVQAMAALSR